MKQKTLFMETTEVPAAKTIGQVTQVLVEMGASSVNTKYDGGRITGLSWGMNVFGREAWFSLPARIDPVYEVLIKRRRDGYREAVKKQVREQAERVAWRQLLRWIEAQAAMVDAGMSQPAEIFMPYAQDSNGATMFENFQNRMLALPAPEAK